MNEIQKKYIENWLKNNPPRTDLTELEENFKFDKREAHKYYPYSIPTKQGEAYRIRKYRPYERLFLSPQKRKYNKKQYRLLCFYAYIYEFNILGYSKEDLKEINNQIDLYLIVH